MDNKNVENIKLYAIKDDYNTEIIGYEIDIIGNDNYPKTYFRNETATGDLESLVPFFVRMAENENLNPQYLATQIKHIPLTETEYVEKKEQAKKVKEKKQANESIMDKLRRHKRAIAASIVITLGLAAASTEGYTINKFKKLIKPSYATAQYNDEIQESNPQLKKIYEKLLKLSDGKVIVSQLQQVDQKMDTINEVALKNKDSKGKVSFVKAEEVAAIADVYNANYLDYYTLHEDAETLRCDYFGFQSSAINLSQGSRDVQEIDDLMKIEDMQKEQVEIQNATQETLNNSNKATKSFITMLKNVFSNRNSKPELQAEVAYGQAGLAAALTNELTGKELENYQYMSKTENGQLGALINDAVADSKRAAADESGINLEKQKLINEAFSIMNEEVREYDRTDYDPSTTEKGRELYSVTVGNLLITDMGNGKYSVYNKITKTTKKISRAEAIKRFGKKKVEEAEKHVKIDTNGDGKNDTPLDEANKDSEAASNQHSQDAKAGFEAGQSAFINGGSSTTSKGSATYREYYSKGYQHAKSVYEQNKKDNNKTEVEDNTVAPPKQTNSSESTSPVENEKPPVIEEDNTTPPKTESRQKVVNIETTETPKEKTYEITMEDGTSYKSKILVRA